MNKSPSSVLLANSIGAFVIMAITLALLPVSPVLAADTGWNSPTGCTSGFGQWASPGNALASDNVYTTSNANNEVLVCSFNLPAIPAGDAITGIEVSVEGFATGFREANVDLSWNGGGFFGYTADQTTSFGPAENTFILGDTSNTWGRTWSPSEFTSANFRVRLTSTFAFGGSTISLDHIQVRVTHIVPPEMDVQGNGISIADGDITPSIADDTDFGTVNVGSSVTHTFTIYNTGTGDLTLSTPTLLGPGATANYTISTLPTSPVAPGGFTTFDVTFSPTPNFGPTKNATVSITNNDPNENPYTFAITGTRPVPEIDIQGNGISIADGDGSPSFNDGTQWGFVGTGISVDHTFTIYNTGDVDLTLANARITGSTISFSVLTPPAATVAPGGSTIVVIRFSPSALGGAQKDAVFLVDTNDPNEDPYNFDLQGFRSGAGAEVEVQGNGLIILDGDATPSTTDGTDFGNVNVGSSATQTFTIYNYGPDDLTVGNFTFTGNFSLVSAPASTVSSGGSTAFDVQFTPGGLGAENGTISFENNDAFNFENPYNFSLAGTGVDATAPTVTNTTPSNGSSFSGTGPSQIVVEFSEDVKNDGSASAANNTANYLLIEDGANGAFNTVSCVGGLATDDTQVTVNTASYDNNGGSGPFAATLTINGGTAVSVGSYRLFVCGTTSIEDLTNNELNGGLNDTTIDFTVTSNNNGGNNNSISGLLIPVTGFPQGQVTTLSAQPSELAYASYSDMWLEIPKLNLKMSIVGVPQTKDGWNVNWLDNDAGWLDGSAFPTWNGNSVITAHVWDALNQPGPFAGLKNLRYGDQVKVHAFGQVFTYEIRESRTVLPTSISTVFKHEQKSWITLITCEDYKERSQTYSYRRMVRAVLISVASE